MIIKRGSPLNLLDGADQIEFNFYGYDVTERMYRWYDRFDGNKMKELPAVVKISYAGATGRGNLMLGINVNSQAKRRYNEDYPQ